MDPHAFDRLARSVAGPGPTRRSLLRGMLGLGAAALVGGRARAVMAGQAKKPLCHVTGNPSNPYEVITVAEPAWDIHFAHGDTPYVDCCITGDCAGGLVCVQGQCQRPRYCDGAGDCAVGQVCHDGLCATTCSADADCGGAGRCAGGTCTIPCGSDAECGAGNICFIGDYSGRVCSRPCSTDADCGAGDVCTIYNICRRGCGGDGDCGAEETCFQGQSCDDFTCDDCSSPICQCPLVGPFACEASASVGDGSVFVTISCPGNDEETPI